MGTYKKGISGSFVGQVESVVDSCWKGIEYMRVLPKTSCKSLTDLQMLKRAKPVIDTGLLLLINALINL